MAAHSSKVEKTAKGAEKGAFETSLTFGKVKDPHIIAFKASTTNLRVAKELLKFSGFVAIGAGVISLGTLYGCARIKPLIVGVLDNTFGRERVHKSESGSLRVFIRCSTDEIFLKILEDYYLGRITERLKDEFSLVGIEMERLNVEIENIEEVNKTKEEINAKRSEMTTEGEAKTTMEMDVHPTKYEMGSRIKHSLDDAQVWIKANKISGVEEFLKAKLDEWKEVKIQFAVIGDSGVGKSAFINAIRGLRDDDEGAAETGVLGTTTKSNHYKHADNSNISYLDMPGTDMPNILQIYEKSGLAECNVFLIISSTEFTPFELKLAKALKSSGRAFFFIRTKIDTEMQNESRKQNFDENKSLKYIRRQLYETTKDLISSEEEMFLISNCDTNKWDFNRLITAISEALFVLQTEFLAFATREYLMRKAPPHKLDNEPEVIYRMTKLTMEEITRVSRMVATDWDSLAGLLDISYEEREEIRTNYMKYPNTTSKAKEVLKHFNDSDCFDRDVFRKCVDELGRHDLINKILPMLDEEYGTRSGLCQKVETDKKTGMTKGHGTEEMQKSPIAIPGETYFQPLSPREMFKLSQEVAVDWDRLAGLMDIAKQERDDVKNNVTIYSDNRSRAEKILSIFNHKKDFSRKKLAECLEELGRYDLSETIITGKWKVERLKVEIENIEEVNKTKKEIYKKRSEMATEGEAKTTMEMDVRATEYEKSYLDEAIEWIEKHGISGVEEFLREKLDAWKEVKIQFGVSGESGAGKSAFINAIRGITDDDEDAAEIGLVSEPVTSEYKHPANSKITFVDLPSLGLQRYHDLQTFCEKFGLEAEYDVFLIVSATRITEYDMRLARKLKSIGKAFFFIRTKIDMDIMNESRKKKFSEIDTLKAIRKNIYYRTRSLMETTEHKISSEEDIFLISNHDTNKWDFDHLIAAISDALPVHQRESFTLSLSNITQECLKRKAAVLQGRIWMVAVSATAGDIVPVPGLNLALDVAVLLEEVGFYKSQLGLPDKDSSAFGKMSPQNQEKVRTFCITNAEQLGSFIATFCSESEVEELSRFTPFIGSVITGSMLFSVAYRFLSNLLNQMESTAAEILEEAIMRKS